MAEGSPIVKEEIEERPLLNNSKDAKKALDSKQYTISFVLVASVVFLSYLQYGTVIPTLWLYLKSFGSDESFYGIVFSAWNLSASLTTLLFGILCDYMSFKAVFSLTLLLNLAGNAVYGMAVNKYMVLIGRVMCGGTYGVGMAFVARATLESERTKILARVNAVSNIGLVVGPALNLVFVYVDFTVGPFHVSPLTVPAYFMFVLLVLDLICILVGLRQPPPADDPDDDDEEKQANVPDPATGLPAHTALAPPAQQSSLNAEDAPLLVPSDAASHAPKGKKKGWEATKRRMKARMTLLRNSLSWTLVLVLVYQFIGATNLATLEALATVMTDAYFGWTATQNSIMYAVIAGIFLVVYLSISFFSRWVTDRYILWVGVVVQGAGAVWCFAGWGFTAKEVGALPLWLFACSVGLIVASTPCVNLASSVFSKSVEMAAQGTWQGIYGLATGLAQMIGPLYGGFAFAGDTPNAVRLLAFFLGLWGALLLVYIPLFLMIPRTVEKMRLREEERLRALQAREERATAKQASV